MRLDFLALGVLKVHRDWLEHRNDYEYVERVADLIERYYGKTGPECRQALEEDDLAHPLLGMPY